MSRSKSVDLIKVTMNLRQGDQEKMGALFPDKKPSVAIRDLISAFVDKHYSTPSETVPIETNL